jgi:hypothetical protein
MAEENKDAASEGSKGSLDLNSLSGLNFGPDWADGKSPKKPNLQRFGDRDDRKRKGRGQGSRDRRSGGRPQHERRDDRRDSGEHRSGGRGRHPGGENRRGQSGGEHRRGQGHHSRPPFEPKVKVDLYPQDEAFDALIARLRASARTYELFDIAQLLLEKPERYVVVVTPKAKTGGNKEENKQEKSILYYSVPGHLPFESEEEAISFVVKEHLDLFFDIEEVEVEPPSGNFQIINRCTLTGELLGPPNYHRYQEFVRQHYSSRITGMSFDRYLSKITGSKEQEDINAWMESMKKGARYTVKDRKEGEPETFDTLESARHFLIMHRKEQVVQSAESVRFAGRDIERLPKGDIRSAVEAYIEQQKHFPLDSANNIRGRLRRHKFAVYKKGSKGVSYVCAVKRKFRDSKSTFTDSIGSLIEFIEQHPEIPASKLPKEYIGIDTEKQKPQELKIKEAPAPQEPEASEEPEAQVDSQAETQTETEVNDETGTTTEAEAQTPAETSTEAQPTTELSAEEQQRLNQLMLDLRWLITEGYVTEYGDGRLFAPAPLPDPKKKKKDTPPTEEKAPQPNPVDQNPTQKSSIEAADKETPTPQTPAAADSDSDQKPTNGPADGQNGVTEPSTESEPKKSDN